MPIRTFTATFHDALGSQVGEETFEADNLPEALVCLAAAMFGGDAADGVSVTIKAEED